MTATGRHQNVATHYSTVGLATRDPYYVYRRLAIFAADDDCKRQRSLARGGSLSKSFRYGPPGGPSITSRQWWVWVRFYVQEDFFYAFINAESTVSTFNNRVEVKVYVHECIFWGCSVDHFWEDNLAIFDHKIYP
jgi:hypothetical protein